MISMDDQFTATLQRAQKGEQSALEEVLLVAEPRIRAYTYRVTLNQDLAEDLAQETCLEIVKSIAQCQQLEKFWPWVYRVAQSKISQHYRQKGRRHRALDRHADRHLTEKAQQQTDTLGDVLQKEVVQGLMEAIETLTGLHRAVLALRCYEQYSYADIATAMDCSEGKARILFFRAKKRLQADLKKRGLDAGGLALGLTLLAHVTAPTPAQAAAVTAATLETSATTALLARLTSRQVLLSLAALLLVATGLWWCLPRDNGVLQRRDIRSLHFTQQSRNPTTGSLSRGAYEQWFYYPEGVDGPLFARMQRWKPDQSEKLCAWLLNENGHYYYNCAEPKVYWRNRTWFWSNGDVRSFPYDDPNLASFLGVVTNDKDAELYFERDPRNGLLTQTQDRRFPHLGLFENRFEYNQTPLETFNLPWPDVPMEDIRDAMHKRGWTYLRITGVLNDQPIQGRAYIPFIYKVYQEHKPWLELTFGQDQILCNSPQDHHRQCWAGLPRPWLGSHSIDLVRRDAARQGLHFTQSISYEDNLLEVTIHQPQGYHTWSLHYQIDLEKDVIQSIEILNDERVVGRLAFEYLQEVEGVEVEFTPPALAGNPPSFAPLGIQWLFCLAQGQSRAS